MLNHPIFDSSGCHKVQHAKSCAAADLQRELTLKCKGHAQCSSANLSPHAEGFSAAMRMLVLRQRKQAQVPEQSAPRTSQSGNCLSVIAAMNGNIKLAVRVAHVSRHAPQPSYLNSQLASDIEGL